MPASGVTMVPIAPRNAVINQSSVTLTRSPTEYEDFSFGGIDCLQKTIERDVHYSGWSGSMPFVHMTSFEFLYQVL